MSDRKFLFFSLQKGIELINNLDENKSEQFIKRIAIRIKTKDSEIFSEDEKQKLETIFNLDGNDLFIVIKSVVYLFKRMSKFVFKPLFLKSDLISIGLNPKKTELFMKFWSQETSNFFDQCGEDLASTSENDINISWGLNAELSNEILKNTKVPKAYLCISKQNINLDLELTHSELHTAYLQFEALQNELDLITY